LSVIHNELLNPFGIRLKASGTRMKTFAIRMKAFGTRKKTFAVRILFASSVSFNT
jgi:hypothetical protein